MAKRTTRYSGPRSIDAKTLVLAADKDYYKPTVEYRFSNGRTFTRRWQPPGKPKD